MRRLLFVALVVLGSVALSAVPAMAVTSQWYDTQNIAPTSGAWGAEGVLALPTSVSGAGDTAVDGWVMAYDLQGDWVQVGWIENPGGATQWFTESELAGQAPVDTYAAISPLDTPGTTVNVFLEDAGGGSWSMEAYGTATAESSWVQVASAQMPFTGSTANWEASIETDTFNTSEAQPTFTMPSGQPVYFGLYGG